MIRIRRRRAPANQQRQGFGLLEVTISVLLIGVLMIVSLQSLGAAKRREIDLVDRLLAQQLASALMNEILLQEYREPDTGVTSVFGPEAGEATGNRVLFDDVDDYTDWKSSPPNDRNGAPVAGLADWTRSVSVVWADPRTFEATSQTTTGLKKITVTVSRSGRTMASVTGYRSIGWVDTIPTPSDPTGNHAPVAAATSPGLQKSVGQTVTFDGTGSTDRDGDYLSYVWNFGDGTTASGVTVSKVYSSPGSYTCTLTVYDGRGGVSTASLVAVISE